MGKDKGSVKIFNENGHTYIEARPFAKILKFQTTWFSKSALLNIKGPDGYFAVLRQGSASAVVNGKEERLPAPAIMRGRDLYAPLGFFAKATGYDISALDGKVIVAKPGAIISPAAPLSEPVQDTLTKPSVLDDGEIILGDEFFTAPPLPVAPSIKPPANPVVKPPLTVDNKPGKKTRKARILIDAGHGGKDPGAVRPSSAKEKEINLLVARELHSMLSKEKEFEVKLTRADDTFIPLGRRAKMANEFKADIFISVHANAAKRGSDNGFEVYFRSDKASSAEAAETAALENEALQYEGKSATAVSFADLLLKSLASNEYMNESSKIAGHIRNAVSKSSKDIGIKTYNNSGIKQADFYVLRGVEAPSVLIELGYLSNTNDKKRLNNKAARSKLTKSIYEGILSYAKAEGWK